MTTTTLHVRLERGRFAQHAKAALTAILAPRQRVAPAPTLPRVATETRAREAQRVREMAHRYASTDPGFASDLYAAADHHEGLAQR